MEQQVKETGKSVVVLSVVPAIEVLSENEYELQKSLKTGSITLQNTHDSSDFMVLDKDSVNFFKDIEEEIDKWKVKEIARDINSRSYKILYYDPEKEVAGTIKFGFKKPEPKPQATTAQGLGLFGKK